MTTKDYWTCKHAHPMGKQLYCRKTDTPAARVVKAKDCKRCNSYIERKDR